MFHLHSKLNSGLIIGYVKGMEHGERQFSLLHIVAGWLANISIKIVEDIVANLETEPHILSKKSRILYVRWSCTN